MGISFLVVTRNNNLNEGEINYEMINDKLMNECLDLLNPKN